MIVDLRDNPGGYVTAARTIASQFIASGPIFWEESADGTQIETDAAPGGVATDPGIRVMVLVNKGSASASEIVSGALQDTKRGDARGRDDVREGDHPAMGGPQRQLRRVPADDREVAHAGQALDPP